MVDLFWNSYTNTAKNVRMIDAHVDSIDVQNDCIKILDEKYDFVIDCTRVHYGIMILIVKHYIIQQMHL